MTDLRASIFIDQLQPQTLAYIATWMRGTLPRSRMAAQIVEIAPGLDVEVLDRHSPEKCGCARRTFGGRTSVRHVAVSFPFHC